MGSYGARNEGELAGPWRVLLITVIGAPLLALLLFFLVPLMKWLREPSWWFRDVVIALLVGLAVLGVDDVVHLCAGVGADGIAAQDAAALRFGETLGTSAREVSALGGPAGSASPHGASVVVRGDRSIPVVGPYVDLPQKMTFRGNQRPRGCFWLS
jgi:hypothetical protein